MPVLRPWMKLLGVLVALFGVGYWMVASRPHENRDLLLGFWSKLLGSLLAIDHWQLGNIPDAFLLSPRSSMGSLQPQTPAFPGLSLEALRPLAS